MSVYISVLSRSLELRKACRGNKLSSLIGSLVFLLLVKVDKINIEI